MNKKEVTTLLDRGSSHLVQTPLTPFMPIGVTRFQVFLAISPILKGKLYWYALSMAHILSDNLSWYKHDLKRAYLSKETGREYLMNKKERMFLENLPAQITIFRAMTTDEFKGGEFGISWTLKKDVAEFFAKDYNRNLSTGKKSTVIHSLSINKSDVIAFYNQRHEQEVVYINRRDNFYLLSVTELKNRVVRSEK